MTDTDTINRLTAELAEAARAKECFQRMTRAHWEALCAMRNSINEYIPMPNTDSGPLFSPEDGPIYADIAERVVADIKESREYALALEQELKSRAEKAERELAAALAGAVKPLEWLEEYGYAARAETKIGVYAIDYCPGQDLPYRLHDIWSCRSYHPTLEAAQAAARHLHEPRILATLHPSPDALQAVTAAAEQRGYAAGIRSAEAQVRSMRATEGVLCQRTQNLIATGLAITAVKAEAMVPADALAAQTRRDAQMRAEGRKDGLAEAADYLQRESANYPDNVAWCVQDDAKAIRALAAQTEEAANG